MRFRYRKSRKLGPLRITRSRSGWSASLGGRRIRLTRRRDGRLQTTIGLPVPGLRLEHVTGGRSPGGRGPSRPRRAFARWLGGVSVVWALLAGWLFSRGMPARFAAALAVGLAALGLWATAWVRVAARRRRQRRRPVPRAWATPRQAERVACIWMRYLGFADAELTGQGADGGLDVEAKHGVAQVKATGRPVGRPVIQQTFGAAAGRDCAVFALGGFSEQARVWAGDHDVALFLLHHDGNVRAANDVARRWLDAADRRARQCSAGEIQPTRT